MRFATVLVVVLAAAPVRATATTSTFKISYAVDGSLTGSVFVLRALFGLIPVDTAATWNRQLLPFDDNVKAYFSSQAAVTSDALVLTTVLIPMLAQFGLGVDERLGKATLLYGEALSVSLFLNAGIKYLVQRPRPYSYNREPRVRTYAAQQGNDSHLSFYSGHASTAFAGAVAGAYVFALSSTDKHARAILWCAELALATATANLRVRAGKHFYSDVIVGAMVGTAVGVAIPLFHQRRLHDYSPSWLEWVGIGSGLVVGALASQLTPLIDEVARPTSALDTAHHDTMTSDGSAASISLTPVAFQHGGGLGISGAFSRLDADRLAELPSD